jgi:hypothetical protein
MTQDKDIVERLLEASGEATLKAWSVEVGKDKYQLASVLLSEAATALQAAQDAMAYDAMMADQLCSTLERREERITELELIRDSHSRDTLAALRERDQWKALAEVGTEIASGYLRERDEARKALEWQPIETAPKDGTRILIWFVHANAQYSKDPVADGWEAPHEAYWIDHNKGGWTWYGLCGKPTKWRPLPSGPVDSGDKPA